MCMIEGNFLMEWQAKDKITESIFSQFAFNHLQMTQTQKLITCRVSKIDKWIWGYEGMCMSRGKFLKPWKVTDKIIEVFFLQFIFYILQMTLTQEIIICRVLKIHEWIWGAGHE